MKQTWHGYEESAMQLAWRIRNNDHWVILFDHDSAHGHMQMFQQEFFAVDKSGFQVIMAPLLVEGLGTYMFTVATVEKKRVPVADMARFLSRITGKPVDLDWLNTTNILEWAPSTEVADVMNQMLNMFVGERIKG